MRTLRPVSWESKRMSMARQSKARSKIWPTTCGRGAVRVVSCSSFHDPRQDRILPQTGDIAEKVPLRVIVLKAWYARWQMAKGLQPQATD